MRITPSPYAYRLLKRHTPMTKKAALNTSITNAVNATFPTGAPFIA
jgi:hypothetical protein